MSDRCAEQVWGNSYIPHRCGRKAKYPLDAPKWCKPHSPEAVALRRAAADAKYGAQVAVAVHQRQQDKLCAAAFQALLTGEGIDEITAQIKAFDAEPPT